MILCSSCPGGWFHTSLEVETLDLEVPGWEGYTWSIVRPVICAAKFSEAPTETAFGREHSVSNIPKNYLDMSHL